MENIEVMKRLSKEIGESISEKIFETYDKDVVASIIEKIVEYIGNTKFGVNFYIDKFGVTETENKCGEKLFFVKGSFYSHKCSEAAYYAFNSKGEYVGCVRAFVRNLVPPTQVEMEYWAGDESHMNQGNMTALAKTVINEIFVDRSFDNFKMRDGGPLSYIDSIFVGINEDNYPSLAVAKKLGFDKDGVLRIADYDSAKEDQSIK